MTCEPRRKRRRIGAAQPLGRAIRQLFASFCINQSLSICQFLYPRDVQGPSVSKRLPYLALCNILRYAEYGNFRKVARVGKVTSAQMAGGIVRRIREDRGISRAALAKQTGIGARTIYALEQGQSKNFGLESYLKLLDALGLSMSVDLAEAPKPAPSASPVDVTLAPEFKLADIWALDGDAK